MMTFGHVIEKRADAINKSPFARESLRLAAIMEKISLLTREACIMSGGTGLDDHLMDVAAQAVAWLEHRAAARRDDPALENEIMGLLTKKT